MPGHTEYDFETAIEYGLTANGGFRESAAGEPYSKTVSVQFRKGTPSEFDPTTALFPSQTLDFIRVTQTVRWAELEAMLKDRTPFTIIESLVKELASKGALGVLRHGFKCYGKTLRLAYFRPNSGMNPEAQARYAANRLTI